MYNHFAAEVWKRLQGHSLPETARRLSKEHSLPLDNVLFDVEAIRKDWLDKGLLQWSRHEATGLGSRAVISEERELVSKDSEGVSKDVTSSRRRIVARWRCKVASQTFTLAFENEDLANGARRLLPPSKMSTRLPIQKESSGPPSSEPYFEVRQAHAGGFSILENGHERLSCDSPEQTLGALFQFILERLHPGTDWIAIFHAGAVSVEGTGIAFPANSGSGKTTLVAMLAQQGFSYLADDFVGVSAPNGDIMPWPVPLNVKNGSWEVLRPYYPQLDSIPLHHAKGAPARMLPPPPSLSLEPVPLRAIIFPAFEADRATELRRLSLLDTLTLLLSDRVWIGYPLTAEKVERFLNWLAGIPSYSLVFRNTDDARAAIMGSLRQ